MRSIVNILCAIFILAQTACNPQPIKFDGQAAFTHVEVQTKLGPRPLAQRRGGLPAIISLPN